MRPLFMIMLCCAVAAATPRRRVVVTDTQIEILSPIRFVGTTATISATSTKLLDAMAATLDGNPSIRVVLVTAFGDDVPVDQVVLGTRRAKAVVDALIRRGVAPRRLRWSGEAHSPSAREPGPRVVILDRAP